MNNGKDIYSMEAEAMFSGDMIKQCVLSTLSQRIWGAWQVLKGEAGIIFIKIKAKDYVRAPRVCK